MKTKLVTLLIATGLFFTAAAQSFHLGIKAGANINKLTGKSFNEEFSYSYHAGAFAEIGLGDKFVLQPEVLFSELTAKTSSSIDSIYTNISNGGASKVKLQYIAIPLLLNYKLSNSFMIQAGPQYGIKLDNSKSLQQNGKDAFKSGDFSVMAGLQLKFGPIRIYGRYVVGLSELNDIDKKDKWKTQTIQAGLGYVIF